MNLSTRLFISVLWFPVLLFGQRPDFQLEMLHSLSKNRQTISSAMPIMASTALYCDGKTLSLVVEVLDKDMHEHRNPALSDHIEVGFALPRSAYPENFEYQFHPHYVMVQPMRTRGEETMEKARFFSGYAEYVPSLDVSTFLREFDYPTQEQILRDTLRVPPPLLLQEGSIPFGIVRFALYPDSRPAIHLNRSEMSTLEKNLGIQLGDLEGGIQYDAERREQDDGYTIHAQFSPQALGFVQLPALSHLRFVVDVFKRKTDQSVASPILSTSAYSNPNSPSTFNLVPLQRPLETNFTPIPPEVFKALDFYPLGIYTRDQWLPNQVLVEGLLYREAQISNKLTEVGFRLQPFRYETFLVGEQQINRLTVRNFQLNRIPQDDEYFLVNNQVIRQEKVLIENKTLTGISKDLFLFPDQRPGIVTYSRTLHHPFGWGPCGTCLDETFTIRKVSETGSRDLLRIRQTDGADAYCQIGDLVFDQFYVSQMDWIREGEVMVLRLNHQNTREKKRIKVAFLENGEEVQITDEG